MEKLKTENKSNLMEKIVSLCKRRGFIFPGSEIYGGLANSWDYGPLGVELKNNIKQLWWKKFVQNRDDMVGVDTALIMNPKVWEASGHVATFNDPMVECKKCNYRDRSNILIAREYSEPVVNSINPIEQLKSLDDLKIKCPNGGVHDWTSPRQFNLMFKTHLGPVESKESIVYLRPETAQGMFVNFKNILDTTRHKIPFGIAQIGKAFRNEITPGNFIFRTREFEQMEIEYFIYPPEFGGDWEGEFEKWRKEIWNWMTNDIGLNTESVDELEIPDGERAHYSKRTIDFEYDFPFGKKELYGLAYRGDFDLANHERESGVDLKYHELSHQWFECNNCGYRKKEEWTNRTTEFASMCEKCNKSNGLQPVLGFIPHVIEPTWGVDRSVLAVLIEHYTEDNDRVLLKLPPKLAPYKVAVFPLLANKPELVKLAKSIYDGLRPKFMTAWDDRGNIGKRYYSQDEIGTPFCVTVDFDSLEDKKVTVRDRDTMKQERVAIEELENYFTKKLNV